MTEQQQGGNVLYRLSEIEEKLDKHDKDLYTGNGKPGLTTRMLIQEQAMDKREKADEKMKNWIVTLVFLVLATLFTLIGNLVKGHL